MHSGRSVASSTVTISQGDQMVTRSLVLLSADEPDVIRHADTPRRDRPPRRVAGDLRGRRRLGGRASSATSTSATPSWSARPSSTCGSASSARPTIPPIDQALVAFSTEAFLIGTAMRPHAGVGQAQAHMTLSTGVLTHTLTYHEPLPRRRVAPARSSGLATPATAAATGGATSSASTGSWSASFVQDAMIRARSGGAGAL